MLRIIISWHIQLGTYRQSPRLCPNPIHERVCHPGHVDFSIEWPVRSLIWFAILIYSDYVRSVFLPEAAFFIENISTSSYAESSVYEMMKEHMKMEDHAKYVSTQHYKRCLNKIAGLQ